MKKITLLLTVLFTLSIFNFNLVYAAGSSGNDKAGSYLNLLRWVSPRTIKEVYNTPKNYKYPFMNKE